MHKLIIALCEKKGPSMSGVQEATAALELEADSNPISEPGKLQQQIRQLLALLRGSLAENRDDAGGADANQAEPSEPLKSN
jgi:hypothetical protein